MFSSPLFLALALGTNTALLLGAIALWWSERARSRRLGDHPSILSELKRLRESVDSLTAEVERIAESQRAAARILHEVSTMRPTFPLPGPKKVIPH